MFHEAQFHIETSYFHNMPRKKWTPQPVISDDLIQIRLKRKWQIAFRRYVMGETYSHAYASYFGLDANTLREWIKSQFAAEMNWENFSEAWQFDHLVPVSFFDFTKDSDLRLCWHFINMRPKAIGERGDELMGFQVKSFFQLLYDKTGLTFASAMLNRLSEIESGDTRRQQKAIEFLQTHGQIIQDVGKLNNVELAALNQGKPLNEILAEQAFLQKFG